MNITKKQIVEDAGGFSAGTTISSVGGAFEVPLMGISKRKFNKRVVKGNKRVEAPQGHFEGEVVLKKDIKEWFKTKHTKPSYDGGKLVEPNSKCETFPYCSQGAVDNSVNLIGESKESMCQNCYEYICEVAEITNKTPEYITKTIRGKYLSK